MKKLRLLVLRSRRDELMHELIRRGCVELRPVDTESMDSETAELLKAEKSELEALEARLSNLEQAIELLEKYTPAVKRIRLRKPELEAHTLLDDTGLGFALRKAEQLGELEARAAHHGAEQKRLEALAEALKPWVGLDVPLNLSNAEYSSLIVGTLPAATDTEKLAAELEELDDRSELFKINEDKKRCCIALLCMKEQQEKMLELLAARKFVRAPVPDGGGSALQCAAEARERIEEHAREEKHCRALIGEEIIHRETLRLAADRVRVKIALAGAEELCFGTESVVLMEGWLPDICAAELAELFEAFGCAYELTAPEKYEYPVVPVLSGKKKHIKPTAAELVCGLPHYGSRQPGALMVLLFALFLAVLSADAGVGLVILLAALTGLVGVKTRGLSLMLCVVALVSVALGAVRGVYFGSGLEHLLSLYGQVLPFELPGAMLALPGYWYLLAGGTAALLLCHVILAGLVRLVRKCRCGRTKDILAFSPGVLFCALRRWLMELSSACRLCAMSLGAIAVARVSLWLSTMTDNVIVCTAAFSLGLIICFVMVLLDCRAGDTGLDWLGQLKLSFTEGRAFKPLEIETRYSRLDD